MMRQFVQITLLTGTLLVGLVPLARAEQPPVSTGMVARVTAVDTKTGMARCRPRLEKCFTSRST